MYNSKMMTEDDYQIRSVSWDGVMMVNAHFSGMAMEWPAIIVDVKTGQSFRFKSNEVMEDHMIGKYSGYAKYIQIKD